MAPDFKSRGVCWLCLKRFELVATSYLIIPYEARVISPGRGSYGFPTADDDKRLSSDIYTRFLHLSSRFLKLPVTTEMFLRVAQDHKKATGESVQAFCEDCRELISYICDLYAELQAIKLRLIWKLGEVEGVMTSGKKSVSGKLYRGLLKVLMEQLKVNSMSRVELFRKAFQLKCKAKRQNSTPKALVPRGLFPEHWNVGYPACKLMLMRLIMVFLLASSHVLSKPLTKSVKEESPIAPGRARRGRGRPKKLLPLVSNEDVKPTDENEGPPQLLRKMEEPEVTEKKTDEENIVKTEGDADADEVDMGEMDMENEDFNEERQDNDSDWSRGAASHMSFGSASDPEFNPKLKHDLEETTPKTRWNLRTRKTRKSYARYVETGSDSDTDDDKPPKKDDKSFEKIPSKSSDIPTTNPKGKVGGGRGWPRLGDAEPTIPCPKCKKLFLDKRCLASHLIYNHQTRLTYSCATCGQTFNRWKDLRSHKRSAHRKTSTPKKWSRRPRKCPICSEAFPTIASLDAHRRETEHYKERGRPGQSRSPQNLECLSCSETFESSKDLRTHSRLVHKSKLNSGRPPLGETKCTQCDLIFPTGSEMVAHRRQVHLQPLKPPRKRFRSRRGQVQVKCTNSKCSEVFPSWREMRDHRQKIHKSALKVRRETKCTKCDLVFPSIKEMFLHRRQVHSKKEVTIVKRPSRRRGPRELEAKCTQCDLTFPSKSQMIIHRKKEHPRFIAVVRVPGGKRKCRECDLIFDSKAAIRDHRKLVHNLEWTKHECHICYRTVIGKERFRWHLEGHENNSLKKIDLWYCESCGKHFYREENLTNHMADIHNNLFTCSICKLDLESGKLLRDHLASHEKPDKFFHCIICFRGFSSQQYFDLHRKLAHHDKRRHHCDYELCNEDFQSMELLKEHLQTHVDEAKARGDSELSAVLTCDQCGKGFVKGYNLTMHELTHTPHNVGRPGYTCPVGGCGHEVRYMESLLSHYNREHGLKITPMKCRTCGKSFGSVGWYKMHLRDCASTGPENEQRFCIMCGGLFSNMEELMNHKKEMHQEKPRGWKKEWVKCPEPDCWEAGTSFQINVHLARAHGKGETVTCDQCGKQCPDLSHLRDHMTCHQPGKHKCGECGRLFKKPYELQNHIESQHTENREKKFICPLCGLSYFTKNGLRFHNFAKHCEEKELKHFCPGCGKGYGRKTLCTLHKKTCVKLKNGGKGRKELDAEEEEEEMTDKSTTDEEEELEEKKSGEERSTGSGGTLHEDQMMSTGLCQVAPYLHQVPQRLPTVSYEDWLRTTAAIGTSYLAPLPEQNVHVQNSSYYPSPPESQN